MKHKDKLTFELDYSKKQVNVYVNKNLVLKNMLSNLSSLFVPFLNVSSITNFQFEINIKSAFNKLKLTTPILNVSNNDNDNEEQKEMKNDSDEKRSKIDNDGNDDNDDNDDNDGNDDNDNNDNNANNDIINNDKNALNRNDKGEFVSDEQIAQIKKDLNAIDEERVKEEKERNRRRFNSEEDFLEQAERDRSDREFERSESEIAKKKIKKNQSLWVIMIIKNFEKLKILKNAKGVMIGIDF